MDPGLREEILSVLKDASDMTIATIRPDGYPQATTVSYVSDGLTIYFGCAAESQKAQNIAVQRQGVAHGHTALFQLGGDPWSVDRWHGDASD